MIQTLRFISNHSLKQLPAGKKEAKMEIQKLENLENKKSFLDEISIFHNYLRTVI